MASNGKMSTINYYGVLGISEKSSSQDIKKSYKKLALKFHPDKNNNAGSEEKFKKIGEAYAHLKDPVKKADFDKKLNDFKFKCNSNSCFAIFSKFANWTQHIKNYHPTPFNCTLCYATFPKLEELNEHRSGFHPFNCNMCNTSFGSFSELSSHLEHSHTKQFKCDLCPGTSFSEFSELNLHRARFHFRFV